MNKIKISTLWLITNILLACQPNETVEPRDMTLQGTLTYLQRIALTSNASAHIELINQDTKIIISEQTISPTGQIPIHFQFTYNSAETPPNNRYVIQAAIKENGQVRFQTINPVTINPLEPSQPLIIRLNIPQP